MKGLVLTTATRTVRLSDVPTPVPGHGELLIKVHAVALNPVDEHYVFHPIATQEQRIIGTDFAGVVVGIGAGLADSADSRAVVGARVAGFLQGACSTNDRPGAFAEFICAPYDLVWSVPPSITLEAASAVSMCGLTAAQGLFTRLGLPCPFTKTPGVTVEDDSRPVNILIYGASTSLGQYAAQLVNLAFQSVNRKVRLIGVAGSSNHSLLRSAPYSYDVLVDYKNAGWAAEVSVATQGRGIDYALDCISTGNTVSDTEGTLNSQGKLGVFRGPKGGQYDPSKLRTQPIYGAVWEGLGVEIGYNGNTIAANADAREFAAKFFKFLGSGPLEPNPVRLMPGGFSRIPEDGLLLFDNNEGGKGRKEEHMRPISAEKLVYRVGE